MAKIIFFEIACRFFSLNKALKIKASSPDAFIYGNKQHKTRPFDVVNKSGANNHNVSVS
ncbi:MAG: hypothetical protein RBS19_00195 [Bacteroidales bacterium]|nr:hypothetical protein [Bacteroidales bacterium]